MAKTPGFVAGSPFRGTVNVKGAVRAWTSAPAGALGNLRMASAHHLRLDSAALARIEGRTQVIGRDLLAKAQAASPSVFSTNSWSEQASEWVFADDEVKVRFFRLVDCMPMLDDPGSVNRHVREYLDDDTLERMPAFLRTALKAARLGLLAPFTARMVRAAMLAQAKRFIAGTTPEEVARAALVQRRRHRGFTLDLLGEAVTSDLEADAYAAAYMQLLEELPASTARWPHDPLVDDGPDGPMPRVNVSLKLSALDSQFDAIDPAGTTRRVLSRLRPVWRLARDRGCQVHVDMESHATKDLALAIFKTIATEAEFRDWPCCGIVVQCYLREALDDLAELAEWGRTRGTPIWVRLVKGAYWDYETVHATAAGWPVPVWQRKHETDACYEAATTFVMAHADVLRPALGSHNLRSIAHGLAVAEEFGVDRRQFEIQMLYGMGDAEKEAITAAGYRMRVYMPYGDLVPGMAYLVRRLLENSSNDSFLRAGFVKHVAPEKLLAVPQPPKPPPTTPVPAEKIASPSASMMMFHNESLTDFAVEANREAFAHAVARARPVGRSAPLVPIVIGGDRVDARPRFVRRDPSDTSRIVAEVVAGNADDARHAIDVAHGALPAWQHVGVDGRAAVLRAAASIMRARRFDLAATQVFEVGKPWREADADVAEAIDFCEFYANEAERLSRPRRVDVPGEENVTTYLPRGVTAVIAPWNFPLAILCGMTAAALVTGNTVVMKPAEQSSLVAFQLFEILREAGVPPDGVAFLPGRGEEVGPVLVAHPATALVAFTGSRSVGLAINTLAGEASAAPGNRLVKKVIAELGGKNAIVVDDDADLDEAVTGVVSSAFGFQGQKCSACSRVIVLEDVYEAFVARLAAATSSLRVGPAEDPGTRVGPVVDDEARGRIESFIDLGKRTARCVAAVAVGDLGSRGHFVGPHVFADVEPLSPLAQEEIFGPVLAVLRARDFDDALQLANGTAYALTAGVYSRSPAHLEQAAERLAAGNIYMNRGITGAFVSRQPFGGYRMSGIGSKTGGPDYLLQFVMPKTVTENTMRRGFVPPATD